MAWLVALGRIHTFDKLRAWNLIADSTRLLCYNVEESRDHNFFDYDFQKIYYLQDLFDGAALTLQRVISLGLMFFSGSHLILKVRVSGNLCSSHFGLMAFIEFGEEEIKENTSLMLVDYSW